MKLGRWGGVMMIWGELRDGKIYEQIILYGKILS